MGKHENTPRKPSSAGKKVRAVLVVFLLLCILLLGELWRSNRALDVEEFPLVFETLPPSFDGFTIAHLTDLHAIHLEAFTPDLIESLVEAAPDAIVITGDLIDNAGDIPWIRDAVSSIVRIAPVYYVSGNHEFSTRRFSEIEAELEAAGATVLRNQAARLTRGEDELMILGVEDPNGPADMLPMEKVVELARDGGDPFFITLHHRYDRFDEFVSLNLPLVLVGHAHGGLIRLPFTDGLFGPGTTFPKRTNGLYTEGGTTMLASRGLGNASYTFRLFCRPHLPIIKLYSSPPEG